MRDEGKNLFLFHPFIPHPSSLRGDTLATEQFDVTVIGSGPGGYVAALRGAQLGLTVALAEKDKRLGGTCTLRGCIPTKQLLMSAHYYEKAQHSLADFGVQVSGVQLAFADVQKRKDKVVMKNSKGIEFLMKKNKITTFKGAGRLALPGKVIVKGEDGQEQTINTRNIVIATGSVVRPIPGFETDGERVVNSDHILELKEVPKSLIVMGAGAVGVEFASVCSRSKTKRFPKNWSARSASAASSRSWTPSSKRWRRRARASC